MAGGVLVTFKRRIMRTKALLAGGLLAAILTISGGLTATAQTEKPKPKTITIKPGDTLIALAKVHDTSYKRIFYANPKIQDPDLILVGDKIRIPGPDEKLKSRPIPGDQIIPARPYQDTGYQRANYQPRPAPAVTYGGNSVWDRLAQCESGGNWAINTGNGYYGGLQFSLSTWRAVGGSGYPHQASRDEQITRGKILQARSGWGQWPACAAKLGL